LQLRGFVDPFQVFKHERGAVKPVLPAFIYAVAVKIIVDKTLESMPIPPEAEDRANADIQVVAAKDILHPRADMNRACPEKGAIFIPGGGKPEEKQFAQTVVDIPCQADTEDQVRFGIEFKRIDFGQVPAVRMPGQPKVLKGIVPLRTASRSGVSNRRRKTGLVHTQGEYESADNPKKIMAIIHSQTE
jgi:hypothetical protein